MSATENTILQADVEAALNMEFNSNFEKEVYDFISAFGIEEPTVLNGGAALYQYKITGELNNTKTDDIGDLAGTGESSGTAYVEGDRVALSKYSVEKVPAGEIALMPYRKRTTAAAIQKAGYEQSVVRTDNQMLRDIRSATLAGLFTSLANGTGTATGVGLQDALAQADAKLDDTLEQNGFGGSRILHFVNRFDIADYLGKANVGLASVYGINYLASFLGVNDIIVTSKVAKGTLLATPAENIRMYAADFGEIAKGGLVYEVSDHGIIGVNHSANYGRVSAETNVLTGLMMLAEYQDFIVKGTITAEA